MAERNLESNIVLQTVLPQPKGNGFESLHRQLSKIETKLTKLTDRDWKIKVTLDDGGLSASNIKVTSTLKKTGDQAKKQVKEVSDAVYQMGDRMQSSTEGMLTNVRTAITATEKGIKKVVTETREDVRNRLQSKQQFTETPEGFKQVESVTDLAAKERLRQQKSNDPAVIAARNAAITNKATLEDYKQTGKLLEKETKDQARIREQLNSITNKAVLDDYKQAGKMFRQEAAQQAKDSVLARNQAATGNFIQQSGREGFVRQEPSSQRFNPKTGELETIQEFKRVSGNVLRGHTVEIIRANQATGEFNKTVLRGAAASRAMGDSLSHSISKVALWSAATGTVFLAVRGFYELAAGMKELEASSTLLARVGRGLGDGFKARQVEARGLTSDILKATAAIGGNSEAALASAAIFAREGKTRIQILESVRASLLAARVAELDVAEATELMSSAMAQFKIPSENAILTLDQLNRLSNSYRVTTGDLLQSISRSGSIIAQQNGRLSELAAVTAVTAANTSRSGAEIGNAIKTISSQLDRVETKKAIFEELGITVHDLGGESKSYTKFLLEMSLALDGATDAEKNLITTQTAGVRQRNILLSQLKNIVEIIKAENVARVGRPNEKDPDELKYGSALAELIQTSDTMEAALSRLRAQALETTSSLGGGFLDLGKDMANILTMILRWTSAGNQLTGGMLSQIAVIAAISTALYALMTAYNLNIASVKSYVTTLLWQIKVQVAAAGSARALASAVLASAASLAATTGIFLAIGAAIYIVIDAFGEYARQQQLLSELNEANARRIDREIENERKRAEAYRTSTEAIVALLEARKRFQAEQDQGKDRSDQIKAINEGIAGIAGTAGLGAIGPGDTPASAQQKSIAAEAQSNSVRAKLIEESIQNAYEKKAENIIKLNREKALLKQGLEAKRIYEDPTSKFGSPLSGRAASRIVASINKASDNSELLVRSSLVGGFGVTPGKLDQAIVQTKVNIEKFSLAAGEASDEVKKLKDELKSLQAVADYVNTDEYRKNLAIVRSFGRTGDVDSEKREARTSVLSTGNELKELTDRLSEVKKATKEAEAALNALRAAGSDPGADDAQRNVVKNLEEEKKLYQQIQVLRLKVISDETRRITNDESSFRQRQSRIKQERKRGLDNSASSFADGIVAIEIERRSLQEDNIALTKEFQQLNKAPKNQAELEQRTLAVQSTQLKIAENLDKLRSLEYERVLSIQEAEKTIAIERKKSADEAARALGSLSSEDKLRAFAQAQYFAANPNAKVSFEQQLLSSREDNAIGNQFFGANYEKFSESGGALATLFRRAGLGVTQDLDQGSAEVRRARGGLSDKQLGNIARANNLRLGQQGAVAEGNDVKNDVIRFRNGQGAVLQNGPQAQLDLVVRHELDVAPMLPVMEKALQLKMQELVPLLAKEVESIIDRKAAISKKLPARG